MTCGSIVANADITGSHGIDMLPMAVVLTDLKGKNCLVWLSDRPHRVKIACCSGRK